MQQTSKMEFFLIVSILALPAILFAQLTGIISDELLYPPDYDFFQQPYDVQTSYNDPVFGTEIKRVTNNIHFDRECLGGYFTNSEPNYFNLDGSYFLAMENDWVNGELEIITYLYNGNTGERIKTIGMEPLRNWWIRWAINDFYTQDGDTVYFDPVYHFYKYEGNEIRLYDVRDMTFVLLHRFDEYEYIGPGGGEGDLSGDGRFWLLDGEAEELFVYDLIDDIKYPASTFDLGSLGSFGSAVGVDYACISPSGQYAVVSWTTEPAANQQFHGIEVYDKNWNYLRQVYPGIVHWEMGIDAYGDEVIYTAVSFGMTEYWAPWGVQGGDLVSIRLVDGAVRLLKNMPKWAHFTLSSSNAPTPQDYIYVSYDDNSEDLLDWWFPFWGEIFELPTDGSGIIRRLVHHRTRPVDGRNEKYYQADINVNRQKTKCIYRSTYNTEIGDIYMFDIGNRTGAADVIQPLSPLQLTSTDSTETSIDLAWQAPPPAPDGDGGSHYRVYRDGNLVGVTVQTTFTDTQLSAGEYYSYEVYAWDDAGNQSATAASASFRTDGMPPGVFDEEFDISLSNYVKYIPNSGPEMSIREREGFMRLQVPSSSVYDHWTSKDLAPQLQRPVENEDWIVETRMELTQVSGIKYHAGLMVWFSQYDLFYWGFTENTGTLYMSRSGSHGLLTAAFTGGSVVDLRIRREGPIYYFDYKAPGDLDWITAGSDAATGIPVNIGVIAKTWGYVSLILDFDYLRLYSGTVVSVLTTSLPGGQENVAYSQQLAASGGTTPYTWNVIDGALPGGLSLSATGEICGSPVAAGDYFFTVQVTDNSAPATSGSRELSIGITALEPLEILTQSLAGGYVGVSYSDQVSAGGGVGPYTWAVTSGALPPGLFLNPSTGAIDGTPIISGISVFEMTVTDSQNPPQTAEKALSTEVTDLPYLDEEFDSGSLNGYTVYIPKSGPEINSTTRPDFLRF
ncbi:putative Ig domain-containing protein, partial [candidate division KSB1 bacterium]|nr:putative Ig domain-containing protein [candidate division KSB1 bacterium]